MSLVNLLNMVVLDNPTTFSNPFQFEITFECLQELDDDLEWKVIYVTSAEDSNKDQTLEEVLVGPVPVGINKFVLQADAPDHKSIPEEDVIGVTVILVTCSYKEQEFARVGYYMNNEYTEPFDEEAGPPKPLDYRKVSRQILADKPRVTRFPIDWGKGDSQSGAASAVEGEGEAIMQEDTGMEEDDDDILKSDDENDEIEEEEDEDGGEESDMEVALEE